MGSEMCIRDSYSGPYHKFFADDTKVVYVRDDNYWGQDASMWGCA